jgi:hypothetical protein
MKKFYFENVKISLRRGAGIEADAAVHLGVIHGDPLICHNRTDLEVGRRMKVVTEDSIGTLRLKFDD